MSEAEWESSALGKLAQLVEGDLKEEISKQTESARASKLQPGAFSGLEPGQAADEGFGEFTDKLVKKLEEFEKRFDELAEKLHKVRKRYDEAEEANQQSLEKINQKADSV